MSMLDDGRAKTATRIEMKQAASTAQVFVSKHEVFVEGVCNALLPSARKMPNWDEESMIPAGAPS
eukprot:3634501-Amphidinium_carterae.1